MKNTNDKTLSFQMRITILLNFNQPRWAWHLPILRLSWWDQWIDKCDFSYCLMQCANIWNFCLIKNASIFAINEWWYSLDKWFIHSARKTNRIYCNKSMVSDSTLQIFRNIPLKCWCRFKEIYPQLTEDH